MKGSVTSRLPTQGHGEGMEASGSSRRLVTSEFKFGESFMAEDGGPEEVKKMAFVLPKTEEKGQLSMDPMVELS